MLFYKSYFHKVYFYQELIERIVNLEKENKQLKTVTNEKNEKSKNKDIIRKSQKPFDFSKYVNIVCR